MGKVCSSCGNRYRPEPGSEGDLCPACARRRTESRESAGKNGKENGNCKEDGKEEKKQEAATPGCVEGDPFLEESRNRKRYYAQFGSFGDYAYEEEGKESTDQTVLVKDPHFVLTLHNLDGLGDPVWHYKAQGSQGEEEAWQVEELSARMAKGQNDSILDDIRARLGRAYSVDPACVVIHEVFLGTTNIGYFIVDYSKADAIELVKDVGAFMAKMKCSFAQFEKLVMTPPPPCKDGAYAVVRSYHVSCASSNAGSDWGSKRAGHNLGGVVLYMKDGKTDWKCNGRHCKIGYIIVKPIEDVKAEGSSHGEIHGNVYKSVFKEEPDNVVGSGFARRNGTWKFNSGAFNRQCDDWHSSGKEFKCNAKSMNDIEREWVMKAVRHWYDTGKQNTAVNRSLVIFKD